MGTKKGLIYGKGAPQKFGGGSCPKLPPMDPPLWDTILTVSETVKSLWKLVNKSRFPKLKDFALKMRSTFGNTYSTCVRAHTFSTLKQVKSTVKTEIKCRPVTGGAQGRTKTLLENFFPP